MGTGASREEIEGRYTYLCEENIKLRVRLLRLEDKSQALVRADAHTLDERYTAAARENSYLRARIAAEEFCIQDFAHADNPGEEVLHADR